uniref:Galaxin-like repeats domain-containing protein n=1 Tax=Octopus bimaculoides TaxID=37653 RepID=A0A0L8FGL5_OCTBM
MCGYLTKRLFLLFHFPNACVIRFTDNIYLFSSFTAVQSLHPWYYCPPAASWYNPMTHLCCGDQIKIKGDEGNTACCGTTPIKFPLERCCGTQVYEAGTTQHCCGTELYDTTTGQRCCYDFHWGYGIHYFVCNIN